jgi:hypothetical protein
VALRRVAAPGQRTVLLGPRRRGPRRAPPPALRPLPGRGRGPAAGRAVRRAPPGLPGPPPVTAAQQAVREHGTAWSSWSSGQVQHVRADLNGVHALIVQRMSKPHLPQDRHVLLLLWEVRDVLQGRNMVIVEFAVASKQTSIERVQHCDEPWPTTRSSCRAASCAFCTADASSSVGCGCRSSWLICRSILTRSKKRTCRASEHGMTFMFRCTCRHGLHADLSL